MAVNLSIIEAAGQFPGFQNYSIVTISGSIPSQTLGVGAFTSTILETPLKNDNSISQIQAQFLGINNKYCVIYGSAIIYEGAYEVEAITYYSGGNVNLMVIAANESAGSVTIPTITITARAFLFLAPF